MFHKHQQSLVFRLSTLVLATQLAVATGCKKEPPPKPPEGKEYQPVKPKPREKKKPTAMNLAPTSMEQLVAAPIGEPPPTPFGAAALPGVPSEGLGQLQLGATTAAIAWHDAVRTDTSLQAAVTVGVAGLTLLDGLLVCSHAGCELWSSSGPLHLIGPVTLDAEGGGELHVSVTNDAGDFLGAYVVGFNGDGDFNLFTQFNDGTAADLIGSGFLTPPTP